MKFPEGTFTIYKYLITMPRKYKGAGLSDSPGGPCYQYGFVFHKCLLVIHGILLLLYLIREILYS